MKRKSEKPVGRTAPRKTGKPGLPLPAGPFQGLICAEGWEEALIGEVARRFPDRQLFSAKAGVVLVSGNVAPLMESWVFAREVLPDAIEVNEPSVKTLVQSLGKLADGILDRSPLPWTFRVQTPDAWTLDGDVYVEVGGRAGLVAAAFRERMETFRRRAMERYRDWQTLSDRQPFVLVQCLILARDLAIVSLGETFRNIAGRLVPAPWPNPGLLVKSDPMAPCRSYYKLEEAWIEAGREPRLGEVCVDLGAAPGGWTWSALQRGAAVVAVDAADLESKVSDHPRCNHLRENGYAYLPPRKVDWLLCDMIVKPLATLGLLERWLEGGHCRGFVVNIKFRGKDPSSILASIDELRERFGLLNLGIRHLFHDRNEITIFSPPV